VAGTIDLTGFSSFWTKAYLPGKHLRGVFFWGRKTVFGLFTKASSFDVAIKVLVIYRHIISALVKFIIL